MKFLSKKFSYCIIILTVLFIQNIFFIEKINAQTGMPFGGIQGMTLLSGTCNASVPDPTMSVHIIFDNVTFNPMLAIAYTHTAMLYGGMNVDLGLYQVGTYIPTPVPCMANTPAGAPVLVWPTMGFYSMVGTSEAPPTQKRLFAKEMVPFFTGIDKNS